MEIFLNVLQGTYAYLLIFQILVVTVLLLALLWLVVRRTKESALYGGHATALPFTSLGHDGQPTTNTIVAYSGASLTGGLLADAEVPPAAPATPAAQLQEKVKYLESKLLEYEILQEEISTLSALKVENEELRKKLIAKGVPFEAAPATAEDAPPEEATVDEDAEVEAEGLVTTEEALADEAAKHDEEIASLLKGLATEPSAEVPVKMEPTQVEPKTNGTPGPEEAELKELENLLSKIDELTNETAELPGAGSAKPSKTV